MDTTPGPNESPDAPHTSAPSTDAPTTGKGEYHQLTQAFEALDGGGGLAHTHAQQTSATGW
jgi:hypothetical protein